MTGSSALRWSCKYSIGVLTINNCWLQFVFTDKNRPNLMKVRAAFLLVPRYQSCVLSENAAGSNTKAPVSVRMKYISWFSNSFHKMRMEHFMIITNTFVHLLHIWGGTFQRRYFNIAESSTYALYKWVSSGKCVVWVPYLLPFVQLLSFGMT